MATHLDAVLDRPSRRRAGRQRRCRHAGKTVRPEARQQPGFITNSWQGWSAPGNGDVLLLKVNLHEVYRVDLTPGTHVYRAGDRFLVNRVRGSDWICSALDLDLTLTDNRGYREPLIAALGYASSRPPRSRRSRSRTDPGRAPTHSVLGGPVRHEIHHRQ